MVWHASRPYFLSHPILCASSTWTEHHGQGRRWQQQVRRRATQGPCIDPEPLKQEDVQHPKADAESEARPYAQRPCTDTTIPCYHHSVMNCASVRAILHHPAHDISLPVPPPGPPLTASHRPRTVCKEDKGKPSSKVRGACVAEDCSLRPSDLYMQTIREKCMCNTTKQRKTDHAGLGTRTTRANAIAASLICIMAA